MRPHQEDPQIQRPRHKFSPEEDRLLGELVQACGTKDWIAIAQQMPTSISAKQARDRWVNYIDCNPKPTFTEDVDLFICKQVKPMKRKWVRIATLVSATFGEKFSSTAIKNRWNLLERRRRQGIEGKRTQRRPIAGIAASTLTEPVPHETLEEALSAGHLFSDVGDFLDDPYGPFSGL
jgi:hypothetical protein